jgi:hypothetical protein
MLAGDGATMTQILADPPVITSSNLNQWVKSDWTESSPGVAEPPAGTWINNQMLDHFFAKSTTLPATDFS